MSATFPVPASWRGRELHIPLPFTSGPGRAAGLLAVPTEQRYLR
ncbi:hypothetical protein [Mycolicibacterium diernhoferi]|nr:hypothetical protein [Mycolicibacterium diernhoferi]